MPGIGFRIRKREPWLVPGMMTHLSVDPDRQRAVDDLFDAALEQPAEQRAEWLRAHCAQADVRAEVEALLEAHGANDPIFDRNAAELAAPMLLAPTPQHIGPYRVLRELGRGGMGVVYLAERADGQYRRRVAVKLLRNSPDAEDLHRRFVAERQILASLNHPNIAQLLDGGVTDAHLPFIVMEYVDGLPITTYCDRQRLTVEERLQLFHDVCAAVHHAHQNLIIHRDIKPSNILVTEDRRVKLLDFGIAKLLNPTLGPADQPLTRTEWRVMTPEYASPEQVRGDSLTTASDVYALGVVLYELLCGRRPHRITGGSSQALAEAISQREPLIPSVAASRLEPSRSEATTDVSPEEIASTRGLSVDRLRRRLQGDLDAIVMMALRKESARRYGSADLMWEDVRRHLDGLPVIADRGTRWYRARKFLGRHRIEATAALAGTLSLVGVAAVAVRQATVVSRERNRAEEALAQSAEVTDFLVRLFRTAAPAGVPRERATVQDMLATGMARVEELESQPIVQARMLDALGQVNDQIGRLDDAERLLRRALTVRRRQYGDDHADVAATLRHLSSVLRQRNRGEEAMQAAREAVAIQRRVLGPKHPEVAFTLSSMGGVAKNATEAESLYRAALEIQRAAFGPEHLEVATANFWLANALRNRGANAEAEALYREYLRIRQKALSPEDPLVVSAMVHLANHLRVFRGQPAEAESLYTRALAILRKHPDRGLTQLGNVLSALVASNAVRGDYERAEVFAREGLDVQRRTLGAENPLTTENMSLLARQIAGQRRYAEAEGILRDAISLIERTLGPQHPRTAELLTPLASVHSAMGRYREAESDLRRALATVERSPGRDRSVAMHSALLADLVVRRGDSTESRALFERAASILRRLPPQPGPDMRAAYAALANHYKGRNQSADEEYFRRLSQVSASPTASTSAQ